LKKVDCKGELQVATYEQSKHCKRNLEKNSAEYKKGGKTTKDGGGTVPGNVCATRWQSTLEK